MGRKNIKDIRRAEIVKAFAKVLADHGYGGATMTAVGEVAGISPGLLHHNFKNKLAMLQELIRTLDSMFKLRFQERNSEISDPLDAYLEASLKLDHRSDVGSAKCWVGIFAEAVRDPSVNQAVKKFLEDQIEIIRDASARRFNDHESSALLAFVIGSLVFGAFAPKKTAGFVLPVAKKLVNTLKK